MDVSGRWLPEGMHVARGESGRVRLHGVGSESLEFQSIEALLDYVRREYPDLGPGRQNRRNVD